ncbi:MAG: ABC transporter substrate-binding protein [Vagococcus sp.]|uniref:ABC transporter substrate-binding protein n=1 Tax=Vagococcus sp. TaxID=1933889 RepID=UPI002FC6A5FF
MKKFFLISGLLVLSLILVSCGNQVATIVKTDFDSVEFKAKEKEKKIVYLDNEYVMKYPTTNIVTASLEAMEDAVALGIEPLGAVSRNGEIPNYLVSDLGKNIVDVGKLSDPNPELIKVLQPDIILGSNEFDKEKTATLEDIASTINLSHTSDTWRDSLSLLGEVSGNKEKATTLISEYNDDLKNIKELNPEIKNLSILILQVKDEELYMFESQEYYNSMLYDELGFKQPAKIEENKEREIISIEELAKINPDIILVEFSTHENHRNDDFVNDLRRNSLWKNMKAEKEDRVYFNLVDDGYQGETYLSKRAMLDELNKKVLF